MKIEVFAEKAVLKTFDSFEVLNATDEQGNQFSIYTQRDKTFERERIKNGKVVSK